MKFLILLTRDYAHLQFDCRVWTREEYTEGMQGTEEGVSRYANHKLVTNIFDNIYEEDNVFVGDLETEEDRVVLLQVGRDAHVPVVMVCKKRPEDLKDCYVELLITDAETKDDIYDRINRFFPAMPEEPEIDCIDVDISEIPKVDGPVMILMAGPQASGKTVLACNLQKKRGYRKISIDTFHELTAEQLAYDALFWYKYKQILLRGESVILDCNFKMIYHRASELAAARKHGYKTLIIWKYVEYKECKNRIENDENWHNDDTQGRLEGLDDFFWSLSSRRGDVRKADKDECDYLIEVKE